MKLRDFHHKDPMRGELTADNVVLDDIIENLKQTVDDLNRFNQTAEGKFATLTVRSSKKLRDVLSLFERGVRNESLRLNIEWEEGKDERAEEKEREKLERKVAKEQRREENRRKFRLPNHGLGRDHSG